MKYSTATAIAIAYSYLWLEESKIFSCRQQMGYSAASLPGLRNDNSIVSLVFMLNIDSLFLIKFYIMIVYYLFSLADHKGLHGNSLDLARFCLFFTGVTCYIYYRSYDTTQQLPTTNKKHEVSILCRDALFWALLLTFWACCYWANMTTLVYITINTELNTGTLVINRSCHITARNVPSRGECHDTINSIGS